MNWPSSTSILPVDSGLDIKTTIVPTSVSYLYLNILSEKQYIYHINMLWECFAIKQYIYLVKYFMGMFCQKTIYISRSGFSLVV